ncbi:MAG: hypothetical protein WCT77_07895 [Bacteroidota bacterium]|jgi:hypothetical protein
MEILLAILLYLGLLMPGTQYTQADIDIILQNNQTQVQQVQNSPELLNQIDQTTTDAAKKIIEEWPDPPPQPILD